MKPIKTTLLLLCLCMATSLMAQHPNSLSRVKIAVPASPEERLRLIASLQLDHFVEQNGFIHAEVTQKEMAKLKSSRYNYVVEVADVIADLERINKPYFEGRRNGTLNMDGTPVNASGRVAFEQPNSTVASIITVPSAFQVQGSYGGYYSYAQMVTAIENLYNTYSGINLVDTFRIGTTVDGQTMYAVKISDNASTDEPNEPECFFQGVQHAREAIGGSSMIFLMQYLCEQYAANNAKVRNLVDNREIYIIVCMNPDGWEYNRTHGGAGAGWRKNRKNNGGGDYGVDLNRNWNVDWKQCTGAVGETSCGSDDPADDTYWGTAAFSEPEPAAVRNFIRSKHIVVANDQHSVGPYFSLPFGRPALHTGADAMTTQEINWYKAIPALMGKYNGMRAGNSVQALGYEVAGGVKDWMFRGDIGTGVNGGLKSTIMGMTGEGGYGTTGASTFWPPSTSIITLCQGMVYQDIQMIYSAGSYVDIQDNTDIAVTATSGNFNFKLRRLGLDNQQVVVTLVPVTNVASVGAPVTVTTANLSSYYGTYSANISYTLPGGITNGQRVRFAWRVSTQGYTYSDTITKFYNPTTALTDNMEGSLTTNWTNVTESGSQLTNPFGYSYTGGNWTFTTGGFTGNALSESANGTDYTAQSIRILNCNTNFNLTAATAAYLTFQTKHFAENFHDKLQIQLSTDAGSTWNPIAGKTTVKEPGTNEGTSINGQPALTGIENEWMKEEFNMSSGLGFGNVRLRFVFTSDPTSSFYTAEDEGFFIDDVKVITSNTPLVALAANFLSFTGKLLPDNTVELKWDAQVDQKHHHFEVEKSADRGTFTTIGTIQGNALYRQIDAHPFVGNNFYRIKEVDVDGKESFSNVINIPYNPKVQFLQLYPNPVKDDLTIRLKLNGPDKITIQVVDLAGRVLSERVENGDNSIREYHVNASTLPANVYMLKVINSQNETISVDKFVKQ